MSNSPLVSYTKISPNSTNPRKSTIKKITIHHMAGNLTVETCGNVFAPTSRQASSNYGIGTDGRVGMYVEEKNRAWTSSNADNDNQAVTIEVANDVVGGNWHVSDVALNKLIDLCVDICKRNGIPALNFTGNKNGNLTMHKWFAATACPGPYLESKFPYIASEVNKKLNTASPSVPTPAPKPDGSAEQRIWNFLKGKGLNDYAVAGVMGNLYAESGLNPCNLQNTYNTKLGMSDAEYTAAVDNGSYTNFVRDSAGYGLAQWTYWSRKEALLNFAKAQRASIGSLEMQLAFLWDELSKSYASVVAALKSATSVQAASTAILTQYERPADQSTAAQNKRAGFGKTYYDKYAKASTPTPAPTNPTTGCKVGDIVNFSGGPVYSSANAATAAHTRNASRCKVTQVYNGKHPYHCISEDGKGVYGWVDAANVGAASASSPKIAVGSTVRITGDKYATGQGIPGWVKKSTHTVSQINGSKALLGANGGICSWVNLADLTLA